MLHIIVVYCIHVYQLIVNIQNLTQILTKKLTKILIKILTKMLTKILAPVKFRT